MQKTKIDKGVNNQRKFNVNLTRFARLPLLLDYLLLNGLLFKQTLRFDSQLMYFQEEKK